MISGVSFDALLENKAFDTDWPLQDLDERGATAAMPTKANIETQRDYDVDVYKWRHLAEIYLEKSEVFRTGTKAFRGKSES